MGDQDRGAPLHDPVKFSASTARSVSASMLDSESSRIRIRGVADHRPGQGRPLALSAGEGVAPLADQGVESLRGNRAGLEAS